MAKKIIILERDLSPGLTNFRYALWVDVPAARQSFYAGDDEESEYKDANALELAALRAGSVVELVEEMSFSSCKDIEQVLVELTERFKLAQEEIDADNPWDRYGTFWDGDTWTVGGVL